MIPSPTRIQSQRSLLKPELNWLEGSIAPFDFQTEADFAPARPKTMVPKCGSGAVGTCGAWWSITKGDQPDIRAHPKSRLGFFANWRLVPAEHLPSTGSADLAFVAAGRETGSMEVL